ncbi:hypothetical protein NL457_29340, partial [Klebsiella pneumoniae]|nr:hypothetical protein [Klebsiella pneumoniae]
MRYVTMRQFIKRIIKTILVGYV